MGLNQYSGTWGWIALTQVASLEPVEGAPLVEARHVVNCQESITLRIVSGFSQKLNPAV